MVQLHLPRLDRIVAIKRLTGQHTARFEQEARAIAALNHPHICQIHDIGPDYLVLEYVEGRPLQGPMAAEDAVQLAVQIASALEVAHQRGILHRDLKPANVMVTADGTAKLLDFGLAKLATTDTDVTRTADGTVMGTAAYMSPEQAEGTRVGGAVQSVVRPMYMVSADGRFLMNTLSEEAASPITLILNWKPRP